MKKLLPFIFTATALIGIYSAKAQITINMSDMGQIGDTVITANDTTVSHLTLNAGGASQTWDYTNIQVDFFDTVKYTAPSSTPYAGDFPGSNLAFHTTIEDLYIYMDTSSTDLLINGLNADFFGDGTRTSLRYNVDKQTLFEFPMTYTSTFEDSGIVDTTMADFTGNADSLRLKHFVHTSKNTDAWGTLKTPAGEFECLRQYSTEIIYDTVWTGVDTFGFFVWFEAFTNIDTIYTYSWFAQDGQQPILEIIADTIGGTAQTAEFKLENRLAAAVTSVQHASCNGDCDGEATVYGFNGTLPYNYQWDAAAGSQTDTSATGLCAGTYSVTITDAANDTAIASVTIEEPASFSATASVNNNVSCKGSSDGEVTVTGNGGTAPYSYSWTGGSSLQTVSNLAAGEYFVTITDVNGCSALDSATVTEPDSVLMTSLSVTDASCDTCSDGEASITASGGTAPYSYAWSDGQTTATATGLSSGSSYDITVTDANGCDSVSTANIGPGANGIQSMGNNNNVSVYPNPTNHHVNIVTEGETIQRLTVYNLLGEKIIEETVVNDNILSLEDNTPGVYIIQIETRKNIYTKRVYLTQ